MTSDTFRWGILGPGSIAKKFAAGLQSIPDAKLVSVGSRTLSKAQTFAGDFGADRAYGSYRELVDDPDVDAIYISTPHTSHAQDALLAIEAGKAVLCEKPFTVNARQASRVIEASRSRGVFVLEAMWTRFFPLMQELKKMLGSGIIGDPRMIIADFGFRAGFDPQSRLFNPELGGGSLLDVGIYPISLASFLFGASVAAVGVADRGETGVDEQAAVSILYQGGRVASITSAVRTNTQHEAWVLGTEGRIKIEAPWWIPTSLILKVDGKADEKLEFPIVGNGYNYQAIETANCVRSGAVESATLPLSETLSIVETMDTLRAQWGQHYPGE